MQENLLKSFVVLAAVTLAYICLHLSMNSSNKGYQSRLKHPLPNIYKHSVSFETNKVKQDILPPEVLDPTSALYGIRYIEEYGKPLQGDIKTEQPYLKDPAYDWRTYMPDVASSIKMYKQLNPANKPELTTCANLTKVIVDTPGNLNVGERFRATIQAFNCAGDAKTFGGDYFRARIIRSEDVGASRPNGIACLITDNLNGTYTLESKLPIPGSMQLEVVLVYSVEGIAELIIATSLRRYSGTSYITTFDNGEVTECNANLTTNKLYTSSQLCDYSNPRNKEPWFCAKPKSNQCPFIKWITFDQSSNEPTNYLKFIQKEMQMNRDQPVQTPKYKFNVSGGYFREKLSKCTTDSNLDLDISRPNGYIYNGHWVSLVCENKLNPDAVFQCFRNKVVYFLGDSTVRQFFEFVHTYRHLNVSGPDSSKVWQQPKIAIDKEKNITFYYRCHGPPLQNPGPPSSRPYISDILNEITGGPDTYIIITISLHLYFYEPSVFIHRIKGIRESVEKLIHRNPGTKIIVKGNNVLTSPQEWLGLRYDNIMSEVFKNMNSVIFLRLWDITTVWPLNDYHPGGPSLSEEILYAFEFFCST